MQFLDFKKDKIFGLKLYFFPRFRSLCGVGVEDEVKLRRKSNVIHHRKSSVLMRLPRLRRPSKSFKRQSSLDEEITIRRYNISDNNNRYSSRDA